MSSLFRVIEDVLLTFVIESIDPVDGSALVVTAQDEKVLWVLDLVSEQQADRLQRLLATVHIVSQEQVVGLWWESSILEQTEQIVVLTVDITYREKPTAIPSKLDWTALD
jgi:hypothetical protein